MSKCKNRWSNFWNPLLSLNTPQHLPENAPPFEASQRPFTVSRCNIVIYELSEGFWKFSNGIDREHTEHPRHDGKGTSHEIFLQKECSFASYHISAHYFVRETVHDVYTFKTYCLCILIKSLILLSTFLPIFSGMLFFIVVLIKITILTNDSTSLHT